MSRGVAWLVLLLPMQAWAVDWLGAEGGPDHRRWGIRGGLQFAIHPAGFRGGDGGPRGLIRLGYPVLAGGQYDLINYIAIEPIVNGRRGFSELERSAADKAPGKRMAAETSARRLQLTAGVELLEVSLRVERFANGAEVRLTVSQRSDEPDAVQFTVRTALGSKPIDYCILTATMGNYARARELRLKDRKVDSRALYAEFQGSDFAPHRTWPAAEMRVTPEGDLLVAITTNEEHPAAVRPFPKSGAWYYGGEKVTQYWKKRRGTWRDDLEVAVNARRTYWQSQRPIPGGVSFENFELRERFYEGQEFVFGLTRKTPLQLGFSH